MKRPKLTFLLEKQNGVEDRQVEAVERIGQPTQLNRRR